MRCSFAAVLSLCLLATASGNPAQWTIASGGNGHLYDAILVPAGIDWFTARNASLALNGDLATITSPAENNFVHGLIAGNPAFWINVGFDTRGPWLGAIQPPGSSEPGGGFGWVSAEPFAYTNWAAGEPNDGGGFGPEDAIHYLGKGNNNFANTWNDLNANDASPRGFIVEFVPEPSLLGVIALPALLRRRRGRGV